MSRKKETCHAACNYVIRDENGEWIEMGNLLMENVIMGVPWFIEHKDGDCLNNTWENMVVHEPTNMSKKEKDAAIAHFKVQAAHLGKK